MAHGKTIELFLVNGKADGIVTVELSNWNGKAISMPRADIKEKISNFLVYIFCFVKTKTTKGKKGVILGKQKTSRKE